MSVMPHHKRQEIGMQRYLLAFFMHDLAVLFIGVEAMPTADTSSMFCFDTKKMEPLARCKRTF